MGSVFQEILDSFSPSCRIWTIFLAINDTPQINLMLLHSTTMDISIQNRVNLDNQ